MLRAYLPILLIFQNCTNTWSQLGWISIHDEICCNFLAIRIPREREREMERFVRISISARSHLSFLFSILLLQSKSKICCCFSPLFMKLFMKFFDQPLRSFLLLIIAEYSLLQFLSVFCDEKHFPPSYGERAREIHCCLFQNSARNTPILAIE